MKKLRGTRKHAHGNDHTSVIIIIEGVSPGERWNSLPWAQEGEDL